MSSISASNIAPYNHIPLSQVSQVSSAPEQKRLEEMIRRLKPAERQALEQKLAELPNMNSFVAELLQCIESGNWGDISHSDPTQHPDMPYYALIAFQRNQLTDHQFGTLLLYWAAKQHHEEHNRDHPQPFQPRVCPLFNPQGELIQNHLDLIAETFSYPYKGSLGTEITLDEQATAQWAEEVKKLPKSEQQFFLVPHLSERNEMHSMMLALYLVGFPAFGCPRDNTSEIIPSVGMVQAFLNVKYGQNAVRIRPVLGLSTPEDLRQNGLENIRDAAFHFPGVTLPSEADFQLASWTWFTKHDWYHAARASLIPKETRSEISHASTLMKAPLEGVEPDQLRSLGRGAMDLADMEHPQFGIPSLREEAFWITIERALTAPQRINHLIQQHRFSSESAAKMKSSPPLISEVQEKVLTTICRSLILKNSPLCEGPKTNFRRLRENVAVLKGPVAALEAEKSVFERKKTESKEN